MCWESWSKEKWTNNPRSPIYPKSDHPWSPPSSLPILVQASIIFYLDQGHTLPKDQHVYSQVSSQGNLLKCELSLSSVQNLALDSTSHRGKAQILTMPIKPQLTRTLPVTSQTPSPMALSTDSLGFSLTGHLALPSTSHTQSCPWTSGLTGPSDSKTFPPNTHCVNSSSISSAQSFPSQWSPQSLMNSTSCSTLLFKALLKFNYFFF